MRVAGRAARAARYTQMEKLLAERDSQRSNVRATGVSRMTMVKLAKNAISQSVTAATAV